jgi:hypothetical protein
MNTTESEPNTNQPNPPSASSAEDSQPTASPPANPAPTLGGGAEGADGGNSKSTFVRILTAIKDNTAGILITVLILVFVVALGFAFWYAGPTGEGAPDFIGRLRDQEYARGLITFIISVSTIILGFVLVIHALFGGSDPNEDRFRRGREVFTGLMGVLGTIVGFYFGAAQQPAPELQVAPIELIKAADGTLQAVTYISGGTPPYRYTVRFPGAATDKDVPVIANKVSESGWIRENVPAGAGNRVVVEITDRVNRQITGSRDTDAPAKEKPPDEE